MHLFKFITRRDFVQNSEVFYERYSLVETFIWAKFQVAIPKYDLARKMGSYRENSLKILYLDRNKLVVRILLGFLSKLWALPMSKIWAQTEGISWWGSLVSSHKVIRWRCTHLGLTCLIRSSAACRLTSIGQSRPIWVQGASRSLLLVNSQDLKICKYLAARLSYNRNTVSMVQNHSLMKDIFHQMTIPMYVVKAACLIQ
jgi:hypothetical protein